MNETGKEVYQMPEGDWAFACRGIISDGFATEKEAELAAEVERLREQYIEEEHTVSKCWEALGIKTYEEAKGKAIWQLIEELVAPRKDSHP